LNACKFIFGAYCDFYETSVLDKFKEVQKEEDFDILREVEKEVEEKREALEILKQGIDKKLNKDFTLNNLFNEYNSYKKKVRYLNEFLSNISKKIETFEE
jgi:uncharacterized phage infection (PIP) family protein YhgE